MILSMKQGQQQKQKLTQEQSFFLDILKFNKEDGLSGERISGKSID